MDPRALLTERLPDTGGSCRGSPQRLPSPGSVVQPEDRGVRDLLDHARVMILASVVDVPLGFDQVGERGVGHVCRRSPLPYSGSLQRWAHLCPGKALTLSEPG
jgi:hypothetical protein